MKVLVIKIGAMGDVVMAMPMLALLKERKAHVTWVCGAHPEPLLRASGLVDELITVNEEKLFKGHVFQKSIEILKVWRRLGLRKFDLVITGHVSRRYRILAPFVRAKKRRSFERGKRPFPVPGRYHADEYVRLATGEEGPKVSAYPFPQITTPCQRRSQLTVALAPGGARNALLYNDFLRRWPVEHYRELALLLQKEGIQVVLTGAETDSWVLPFFEGVAFENLIGKNDVSALIAFLREAHLLITHDSGPMHFAKLAECPVLALFGPTNPWEKVSSREKVRVIWGGENLPCRPCYDGKHYAPCQEPLCLTSITPERVFRQALEMLRS